MSAIRRQLEPWATPIMHAVTTVALLLATAGCHGRATPPRRPADQLGDPCDSDRARCERAVLAADRASLGSRLASYDQQFQSHWGALYDAMRKAKASGKTAALLEQTPYDQQPKASAAGAEVATLSWQPVQVPTTGTAAPWMAKLARESGLDAVVWSEPDGVRHLALGADPLAPFVFNVAASWRLEGERKAALDTLALVQATNDMLRPLKAFDYVSGATARLNLQRWLTSAQLDSDAGMRTRFALRLFRRLGLQIDGTSDAPPASSRKPTSDYASLLHHLVAKAPLAAGVAKKLTTEHRQWLSTVDQPLSCAILPPATFRRATDLPLLDRLASTLDSHLAPGAKGEPGKLSLDEWLVRYHAAIETVRANGVAWAFMGHLLRERGTAGGLTAASGPAFRRVSQWTESHLAGLSAVTKAPAMSVQAVMLAQLAGMPGLSADRKNLERAVDLLDQRLQMDVARASGAGDLIGAAIAAFSFAQSNPRLAAGLQRELSSALRLRLDGDLASATGWSAAILHAAATFLELQFALEPDLKKTAAQIQHALDDKAIPYAAIARLLSAVVQYGVVQHASGLNASIKNPKLMSDGRVAARKRLRGAISSLALVGPASARERDLLNHLIDLADGLVVAQLGKTENELKAEANPTTPKKTAVVCPDAPPSPDQAAVLDRLRKTRRRMLKLPALVEGDGGMWQLRARGLAVLLSDAIDVIDSRYPGRSKKYALPRSRVDALLTGATKSLSSDPAVATATVKVYLAVRSHMARRKDESPNDVGAALNALSQLMGSADPTGAGETSNGRRATPAQLYQDGKTLTADIALLNDLAAAMIAKKPMPDSAVALAKQQKRSIALPLAFQGKRLLLAGDPTDLEQVYRHEQAGRCDIPKATHITTVMRAIRDFRAGHTAKALASLDAWRARARTRGLRLPKQSVQVNRRFGDNVLIVGQSAYVGEHLLRHAGEWQLSFKSRLVGSKAQPNKVLEVRTAITPTSKRDNENPRYFAHVVALSSVYHGLSGDPKAARAAAMDAISVYADGVMMGRQRHSADTTTWARDATATLLIAAELAASRGEPFVAGDLFTLAQTSLPKDATAADVLAVFEPLPRALDLPELAEPLKRAKGDLRLLTRGRACTNLKSDPSPFEGKKHSCQTYPRALALRVADGLATLPRLKKRAADCDDLRGLDRFLAKADRGSYDPKLFRDAVAGLAKARPSDAAMLLTRHRDPRHCTSAVVRHARSLSGVRHLGPKTRGDLLRVAINCDPGKRLGQELIEADRLARSAGTPMRNLELLAYAVTMASTQDDAHALYTLTHHADYLAGWYDLGADVALSVLALHHASAVLLKKPIEARRADHATTAPLYRLLCTSLPRDPGDPSCSHLSLLRDHSTASDEHAKSRVAKETIRQFLNRTTRKRAP